MRLTEHQISLVSFEIARDLLRSGSIEGKEDDVADVLRRAIVADLKVEDAVNDEVREILKGYQDWMRANNVEYTTMFERIKKKLVAERKLVL